jgi:hypothetical protein
MGPLEQRGTSSAVVVTLYFRIFCRGCKLQPMAHSRSFNFLVTEHIKEKNWCLPQSLCRKQSGVTSVPDTCDLFTNKYNCNVIRLSLRS